MSNGIVVFSKTDCMACATLLAMLMPLDKAKTEGPEPEMPDFAGEFYNIVDVPDWNSSLLQIQPATVVNSQYFGQSVSIDGNYAIVP